LAGVLSHIHSRGVMKSVENVGECLYPIYPFATTDFSKSFKKLFPGPFDVTIGLEVVGLGVSLSYP